MGYTHYWHNTRDWTADEWARFQEFFHAATSICTAAGIGIGDYSGEKGTAPDVNIAEIVFNGIESDGYETARFSSCGTAEREFCKTNQNLYDALVVACCMYGAEFGPLTWTSDGDDSDHADGLALYTKARGRQPICRQGFTREHYERVLRDALQRDHASYNTLVLQYVLDVDGPDYLVFGAGRRVELELSELDERDT